MADRIPLIVNPSASQIQELPVGDSLTGITTVFAASGNFNPGPVLIGGGTSTGTESQSLQVTGGAYVSGSIGIGTTNPQIRSSLHILDTNTRPSASFPTLIIERDAAAGGDDFSFVSYTNTNLGSALAGLTGLNQFGISASNPGGAGYRPYATFGPDQNEMRWHPLIIGSATSTGTASQPLQVTGGAYVSGDVGIGTTIPAFKLHVVGSFGATTKSFIIDHPTKEGKKLQYGSLEGPELGVYVRGRTQEATIELPEYWTKLVDAESITVSLTPIGNSATPRVEKVSGNVVYVFSKEDGEMDYYYTVFAERCDVDKLEVEI